MAVAEGLGCGVPAVAFSDCTGVNKLVRHRHNGLLVDREGGASAMAAAIENLISDERLRQELGDRGPASIEPYNVRAYVERWEDLITRVSQ